MRNALCAYTANTVTSGTKKRGLKATGVDPCVVAERTDPP